jgi:hypothetical protein
MAVLTMEVSRCARGIEEQRLLWRFPCSYAVSSAWRTPSLKTPDCARGPSNLSVRVEMVPSGAVARLVPVLFVCDPKPV